MKKTYNAPLTEVRNIAMESMVCTSIVRGGNAADEGITDADVRGENPYGESLFDDTDF